MIKTNDRKVNVSKKAAIDFLRSYQKVPVVVAFAFDDWIQDIQICATT